MRGSFSLASDVGLYNEGKLVDAREMMMCCAQKHAPGALKWQRKSPLPTEELKPFLYILSVLCALLETADLSWLALSLTPLFTLHVLLTPKRSVNISKGLHSVL